MNIDIFPTTIGKYHFPEVVDDILSIANKYLNDNSYISQSCQYKTTYGSKLNENIDVELKLFYDLIQYVSADWLMTNLYPLHEIKKIDIFFNEMHKGDSHYRHSHPNCHMSGVFYLTAPNGSGDFCFIDPNPVYNILDLSGSVRSTRFKITPTPGLLLLFPSWLEHEVETCNCEEPRISAPFNITYGL